MEKLILRKNKECSLTKEELDGNFITIQKAIDRLEKENQFIDKDNSNESVNKNIDVLGLYKEFEYDETTVEGRILKLINGSTIVFLTEFKSYCFHGKDGEFLFLCMSNLKNKVFVIDCNNFYDKVAKDEIRDGGEVLKANLKEINSVLEKHFGVEGYHTIV